MGKPKISLPPPSAAEEQLRTEQSEMLRLNRQMLQEQTRRDELLAPYLYKQAGITPKYDAAGTLIGFEDVPDELKGLRTSIEKGLLERSQAAIAGTLPVDPALERNLVENEAQLRDVVRRQLGPGGETSTPGIQMLADFMKRKEELRSAARTGQMTLAEQLGVTRQQANDLRTQSLMARAASAQGYPFQSVGQYGTLGQLFGEATQPYQKDRFGMLQADYWRATSPSQTERWLNQMAKQKQAEGQLMQGMGSLMGGIGGAFSDRRLKRNLRRIAEDVRGFGIYLFRFLWSPRWHVGVLAQEVQPIMPQVVHSIGGILYVDYGRLFGGR